jgi:hypothetical protein
LFRKAKAQVRWMVRPHKISDGLAYITVKGWKVDAHSQEGKQRAIVLDSMMSAAHDAISVTTAIPDQYYRHVVQANVIPDLLKSTRIDKRSNAVHPGAETLFRKTSGNGDHVLLGDACINKAPAHLLAKRLKRLESKVAGEKHESRIGS